MVNSVIPYRVAIGDVKTVTDAGVTNTTSSNSTYLFGNEVKTGSPVPGYIDKLRRGVDASSNYTREGYVVKPGRVSMGSTKRWGGSITSGTSKEQFASYALPIFSQGSKDVSADASNRLKRKLREFTGQSNQLTNIAELREVPKTIRAVAGSATKLVTTVLNSNRRGRDLRAFASDQWLTWSFGVLPTLGAVDDAISSLNDYLARKDHKIREYGIHDMEWFESTQGSTSGSYHYNVLFNGSFKFNLSCKITAGYKYNLLSSNSYNVQKHLGLDISSVVPTAYELLPYSWLIDYFTTAGSFIEDSFAADFGQSVYLCKNDLLRVKGSVTAKPVAIIPQTGLDYFYSTPCMIEYYKFTRTVLTSLPRAPLRFKTSDEMAYNAINKLLNLTSILGSKK